MTSEDITPDYGLILPLGIPSDSLVPDPATGASGPAEYDRYFRILRDHPGLLDWTRSCLRIEAALLEDLAHSTLPVRERNRLLEGLLSVQRVTLERWLAAAEAAAVTRAGENGAGTDVKERS